MCSGWPSFSMRIVTTRPARRVPSESTFVTLPTFTPAMRTGELTFRSCTERNAARTSKCEANGLDFVNPK